MVCAASIAATISPASVTTTQSTAHFPTATISASPITPASQPTAAFLSSLSIPAEPTNSEPAAPIAPAKPSAEPAAT